MRRFSILFSAVVALVCFAGSVRAEKDPPKKDPPKKAENKFEKRFKQLDTNKDDKLTIEEFTAEAKKLNAPNRVAMLEAIFKRMDKNKDNSLTLEEFSVEIKRADD